MNNLKICCLLFFLISCGKSEGNKPPDAIVSTFPSDTAGDSKRFVALFYFSGFGETLFANQALSPSGDAWISKGQIPQYSPPGFVCFWGKPKWAATHGDGTIKNNYRFYYGNDPSRTNDSLLDYHAEMITQAGVDLIVLDFTNGGNDFANGPTYVSATTALCNRWQQRLKQGLPIPKICFFVRNEAALSVIEEKYFTKYNSDLFFNYLDKKLLLVAKPNNDLGEGDAAQIPVPTNGKFINYTTRHCWGLNNNASCWQFKVNADVPPPAFSYNGKPEQMCAPVSTQASYLTMDGVNVTMGAQGRQGGAYFKKYMLAATKARVKFVFIHSWNEWHALNVGPSQSSPYYVDQWNTEYSSDIEPMNGGHSDKYYQLMKEEIAKFKQ